MIKAVGPFRKSSYSAQLDDCVEVADTAPVGRAVRDSKQDNGPLLTFSHKTWMDFLRQFS
ncbi:DUF397 domain-containing protein [Streptomyces sp. NPDC046976]|uniref:DUF397 domain-containing protein n=1 Tax=Streptomyces sp. NPDC046976 TaxID=3155258 RepID=UPI003401BC9C